MQRRALISWMGLVSFSFVGGSSWAVDGPCSAPSPVPPPPVGARLVLAEYQVWHGLPSHSAAFYGASWLGQPVPRAYDSRDPAIILSHINKAKARGIDGFVVDWYGPGDPSLANHKDRAFMDEATSTT